MKYLIIPDVHGRTFWKNAVSQKTDDEIVIFLGDYLEPYTKYEDITHNDAYDNFKEIIEYKKKHLNDCILLLGNHDFACINSSMISCRHDYQNAKRNTKIFLDNMSLFKICYEIDGNTTKYILSHSGINHQWYEEHIKDIIIEHTTEEKDFNISDIVRYINDIFANDYVMLLQALNIYSRYRGMSYYNYGSCIWADVQEWSTDKPEFPNTFQIFGHTQLKSKPIVTKYWADLDCRRSFWLDTDTNELSELNGTILKETNIKNI